MVATPIAVTQVSRSGTAVVAGTAADAVNGNAVQNDGKVWLEIVNTSTTIAHSVAVTVAQAGPDGNAVAPHNIPLAANEAVRTDVWPPYVYGTTMQLMADNVAVTISPYRHS